jgi:hypothetical protein
VKFVRNASSWSAGNCPLGPLLRRLGDETPFFELYLPPRAAKLAIPILAAICVLGAVLLANTHALASSISHQASRPIAWR